MRYTIYQLKTTERYFYIYNGTPKLISKTFFKTVKNLVETGPSLELLETFYVDSIKVAYCNALSELPQTHPELFI